MTENHHGTGRDIFYLYEGEKHENGTVKHKDIKSWRGGRGSGYIFCRRDGKTQRGRFSRWDGTVNILSLGGTGRYFFVFLGGARGYFFFSAGRDGTFFSLVGRDGNVFFLGGAGR